MKMKTVFIVQAALVAAVYASLTLALHPISFGILQFRVSEALTVLPAFMPAAIPGLFVGCLLANTLGGFGWVDIVFGSSATLLAGWLTWLLRRHLWTAPIPPVAVNTLIVGSYIWLLFDRSFPYGLSLLWFALGQAGACFLIGYPLLWFLHRNKSLQRIMHIER